MEASRSQPRRRSQEALEYLEGTIPCPRPGCLEHPPRKRKVSKPGASGATKKKVDPHRIPMVVHHKYRHQGGIARQQEKECNPGR